LGRNYAVQDRLRREVELLGREPTYDDFLGDKLPYLDAVTKEAMRLYTPVSNTERVALQDDIIPLKNPIVTADGTTLTSIKIKAGQNIHIPSISINRYGASWGPTGAAFDPSRWLPESTTTPVPEAVQGGWQHLMTFNEGPRLCLGYRLAIFEYKAILASLILEFRFEDVPGQVIKNRLSVTMQPYVVGEEAKGASLPVRVGLVVREAE